MTGGWRDFDFRSCPRWLVVAATSSAVLLCAGSAHAKERAAATIPPSSAPTPTPVEPQDLGTWAADRRIIDRILTRPPIRRFEGVARSEVFSDPHGHRITLATAVPGLSLAPYAQVFAGIYHHDEIQDVTIEIVATDQIETVCGPEAVGCYLPEDPAYSYRGTMWIPASSPSPLDDWTQIAVHEYGHHVDNQLLNFADVLPGLGCDFASDGSRNWFFEREIEDHILSGTTCDPDAAWESLLGELYADDFTWLNGNTGWWDGMPVPPPTERQLAAMQRDFDHPLPETRRIRATRKVRRHRMRTVRFRTRDWHFVTLRLTGRPRADLDLFLYTRTGTRPLERSRRPRSKERIWTVLPPGRYDVVIYAYRRSGHGRLKITIE